MTDIDIIQNINTWLTDNGVLTGYTKRRIIADPIDLQNNLPLALISKSGSGIFNSNIEERDYYIRLFNSSETGDTVKITNDMDEVNSLARSTVYPAGVAKCRVIEMPANAIKIENDNVMTWMQIRLTIEV